MLCTSYMAPCVQDLRQVVVVCCERQSQSFIPSKKRQILGCFCMHGMHLTKNLTITIDNKLSIYSSDADVEVLACHHQTNTSAIIAIVSGTQNHSRIVNITSVCNQLGEGKMPRFLYGTKLSLLIMTLTGTHVVSKRLSI